MLRSEVEWFPRFIAICKNQLDWWSENDCDYDALKYIIEHCENSREVWGFLMEYNETYFIELIQRWQSIAKKCIKREREHQEFLRSIGIPI